MMVPADQAAALCAEIEALDGVPAWIIGRVVEGTSDYCVLWGRSCCHAPLNSRYPAGTRSGRLADEVRVVEVETPTL